MCFFLLATTVIELLFLSKTDSVKAFCGVVVVGGVIAGGVL